LALVELPKTMPSAPTLLPGDWGVAPLTERLERTFATRFRDLPAAARSFLLTFAADTTCGLRVVMDAASTISAEPVNADALQQAVDVGIVEYADAGLRFSHPLMRSAIYSTAGLHDRLAAHRALATAMRRRPKQAIWHRTAAALGPDDRLSEEVEQLACAASGRRAATVALTALRRAAPHSPRIPNAEAPCWCAPPNWPPRSAPTRRPAPCSMRSTPVSCARSGVRAC
jgi:hypothetical protein